MYEHLDNLTLGQGSWKGEPDDIRRWSYGDVENNGVYYHPNLTHYAHQVFEAVFFQQRGLHYTDLSGRDHGHQRARERHSPPIDRMTFPVEWLHQYMRLPMRAGDVVKTRIDTIGMSTRRAGVRAWIYTEDDHLAAAVLWVRAARILEPDPRTVDIPEWFLFRKAS